MFISVYLTTADPHTTGSKDLCGLDDSVPSHKTVPMLSTLLISYVTRAAQIANAPASVGGPTQTNDINSDTDEDNANKNNANENDANKDEYSEGEHENVALKILIDQDGILREANQVVNYLYRYESLRSMAFYNFCRCVRLKKMSTAKTKNMVNSHLGVLTRNELKPGHPSAETHQLVEHTNELRGEGTNSLIPRVMGMSIPRKSNKGYWTFTLAHFILFDTDNPLLMPGQTADSIFENMQFAERHLWILNNWEAIHKCHNECDADQMHKRAEKSQESRMMTKGLHGSIEAEYNTTIDLEGAKLSKARDICGEVLLNLMWQCSWIQTGGKPQAFDEICNFRTDEVIYPEPTPSQLKEWASLIKQQESVMMARRRNAGDFSEQMDIHETETPTVNPPFKLSFECIAPIPVTEVPKKGMTPSLVAEKMCFVVEKFDLNRKQTMVYNIITQKFVDQHVLKTDDG